MFPHIITRFVETTDPDEGSLHSIGEHDNGLLLLRLARFLHRVTYVTKSHVFISSLFQTRLSFVP